MFGKNRDTIVVTKLGERDEGAGAEIVKDESRLSPIAEEWGQREYTGVRGAHDGAIGRKNSGAIGDRKRTVKVHRVSTSDKRGGGARIENDRW